MGAAFLKLWEALGGSLGVLIVGLIFFAMFWAWRREVQRAENDRKVFWAGMKEEREAREKQAERDRVESKERDERDRAESKERDERIRAEAKEQSARDREAFEARADRVHAESKEQAARDREAFEARADRVHAEAKEQAARDREAFEARADRVHAESKEQAARDREAFEARAERIHAESKERDERDRAAHEARANRDSEQNAHDHARLFNAIAALQGDVKVLLDRSNRSSGGEPGGQPRPFDGVAHQATPDQCDEDGETSSDDQVAPVPSATGAKDPAD